MPRFVIAICLALLCSAAVTLAQDNAPASAASASSNSSPNSQSPAALARVWKVCSKDNPPPCATAPRVTFHPDPTYTDKARKKKISGEVILSVILGPDGRPRDVRVTRSLDPGLDAQSIKAVRQWRFEPGTVDNVPVTVQFDVETSFRIY